jgi:hypothetical protein
MANGLSNAKLETIRQELRSVQSSMDKYDDMIFKIRGWEVTIWTALMVVLFQSGKHQVLAIAMTVPFIFWVLDAMYHSFRMSYRDRRMKINIYLSSARFEREFVGGKIGFGSPEHPVHDIWKILHYCFRPTVFLLHAFLFAVATAMYVWIV